MLDLKAIVITAASALIIGATAGWTANGWRLNGKIDQMISRHSQDLSKATEAALIESVRLQKLKDDALNEANEIAQQNAKAATSARFELDRLRRQLANRTAISDATCTSARNYASTLSVVFAECSTRLTEVAKDADGHAVDSRTFQNAWPRK